MTTLNLPPKQPSHAFNALTKQDIRFKLVDIGANPIDGVPPYAELLRAGSVDVVGFEPNPEALAKLNTLKGPTETYLPHAVGDGKRHTLNFCNAPGMTSLLTPDKNVLNMFHGFPQWGHVKGQEEIDTVRLDDIPETENIEMIKIDIQGGELMAFQNAQERLKNVLVIHTEVEFVPLYEGQPLFSDVEQFLRSQGFMFHRFFPPVSRTFAPMVVDNNIYAGLSQLVWADAIFVRDFTRLDRFSDKQLVTSASILHDCYQSYDLALRFLLEHDRRTNGAIGQTYLAALSRPAAQAA